MRCYCKDLPKGEICWKCEERRRNRAEWEDISKGCPWNEGGDCQPNADPVGGRVRLCLRENCPMFYFMKEAQND